MDIETAMCKSGSRQRVRENVAAIQHRVNVGCNRMERVLCCRPSGFEEIIMSLNDPVRILVETAAISSEAVEREKRDPHQDKQ